MSSTFGGDEQRDGSGAPGGGALALEARPDQRLIQVSGCERFVDLQVIVPRVPAPENSAEPKRNALALALVLDRGGSMQGEKLSTAKRAALAVIDRLEPRDRVAVVIFDDRIETIQPAAAATDELKARVRSLLAEVGARAQTALHEGWLTGCDAIAADDSAKNDSAKADGQIARCFLLTDGLANVGLTDPERIAAQAADVRERAGISTSTFGIGLDYSEELLGPMAEAGGGTFHHLRTPDEIAKTFVGELGQLFTVVARQVRLELEVEPGMGVEVISGYYVKPQPPETGANEASGSEPTRWSVALGDLVAGDEHHAIARIRFPSPERREQQGLRARLVWVDGGAERATDWRDLTFTYATDAECAAETPDPSVARYAGQHLSDHAMRTAIRRSKTGDLRGASHVLRATAASVHALQLSGAPLASELERLRVTGAAMASGPLSPAVGKEAYFQAQARSSGKKDLRGGDAGQQAGGNPPASASGNAPGESSGGATGSGGTGDAGSGTQQL